MRKLARCLVDARGRVARSLSSGCLAGRLSLSASAVARVRPLGRLMSRRTGESGLAPPPPFRKPSAVRCTTLCPRPPVDLCGKSSDVVKPCRLGRDPRGCGPTALPLARPARVALMHLGCSIAASVLWSRPRQRGCRTMPRALVISGGYPSALIDGRAGHGSRSAARPTGAAVFIV
jgi:hypothetical protein